MYTTVHLLCMDMLLFSHFAFEGGRRVAEKMDKQSEQRQPLRKKGVQSEGKEGEERGEKR